MNVSPSTYVEQIAAISILEDLSRGELGTDIAAVVLARDPRVIETTLGVAVGLLRSALDAEPGTTVVDHMAECRRQMESRDIDLNARA